MEMSFSRRLAAGFLAIGTLAVAIALVGAFALTHVVAAKDRVLDFNEQNVKLAQQLQTLTYRKSSAMRGYLMTGQQSYADAVLRVGNESQALEKKLMTRAATAEGRQLAQHALDVENEWNVHLRQMTALREQNASPAEINHYMTTYAQPKRAELEETVNRIAASEEEQADRAAQDSTRVAGLYRSGFLVAALLTLVAAVVLPFWLNRKLGGEIKSAMGEMRSSSTELQTTATQQATGAREQATAMSEITTTMTELLTTSRQIAQSAQRVAGFIAETRSAAQSSDAMVQRARGSSSEVRSQVDAIVGHMLELGRKSQQVGGVTELMSELADQTNILAINANIEAVGAGEAGRRFGVVAEEIRNLADRMAAAAREIRGMVEEVRGAVNTTVMATEGGSKAVDAGARDFDAVSESLEQILSLGETATDAAREIELSTKQQSTAVEQVNVAVGAVAQVAREVEASTSQASQTASELARLSARLSALVQTQGETR